MQKHVFKREKSSKQDSQGKGGEAREHDSFGKMTSDVKNSSETNCRNMTKEEKRNMASNVLNHEPSNETTLKRLKRKFLRRNYKVEEEGEGSEMNAGDLEIRKQNVEWNSNGDDDDDDDHVYDIPFANCTVKKGSKEDEHFYENGYVWAANNVSGRPPTIFRNKNIPNKTDVHTIDALHDDKAGNSERRENWQQEKSLSLPAGRMSKEALNRHLFRSTSKPSSFDISSDDDSSDGDLRASGETADRIFTSCKSKSLSLPLQAKLNLNCHFLAGLNDLCKCGWYWGPLKSKEAEAKLDGKADGTFLVRDSNDNRYLLSLSFRSEGRTLHTRIEFCKGKFSFYAAPFNTSGCHESIVDLIDDCVTKSKDRVFCYSKGRGHNGAAFPVRLVKSFSRFEHVCSLQHLCRFVIRQRFTLENIDEMPLPRMMKNYLEKNHFDTKDEEK